MMSSVARRMALSCSLVPRLIQMNSPSSPRFTQSFNMAATYVIREATISDAEKIHSMLREEIWAKDPTWDQGMISHKEFNKLSFGANRSMYPFVAEYCPSNTKDEGKTIVGCAIFSKITDYFLGNQSYIQGTVVYPEHRGKGVAEELAATVLEFGLKQGCKSAFAVVERDNHPPIVILKKAGGRLISDKYCAMQIEDAEIAMTIFRERKISSKR